jgi:hypothetical protein
MKNLLAVFSAVSILFVGANALGQQQPRGEGGWGHHGQYGRLWDPNTVETVKGEIVDVKRVTPMKGMGAGIHFVLKTDKETISVHLGPQWYIENQDMTLKPKDKVEVTGSRVKINDVPVILAAEVVKDDQVLKLRDEHGVPMWAGWRHRGMQQQPPKSTP